MIRLIGLDNKNPKIEFYYSRNDAKKTSAFLKRGKIGKFAIVHPGFGGAGRDRAYARYWPAEFYASLIGHIIKNYKLSVVMTGIKEESEFIEEIVTKCDKKLKKKIQSAAGRFNLAELGALTSRASLVIAPDTSIVHIAAAFGIKTIDFMSFSNDVQWHPYQKKSNYATFIHPYFTGESFQKKLVDVKESVGRLLKGKK
jgi:ADP-heptose:LPS heptosyltransferase